MCSAGVPISGSTALTRIANRATSPKRPAWSAAFAAARKHAVASSGSPRARCASARRGSDSDKGWIARRTRGCKVLSRVTARKTATAWDSVGTVDSGLPIQPADTASSVALATSRWAQSTKSAARLGDGAKTRAVSQARALRLRPANVVSRRRPKSASPSSTRNASDRPSRTCCTQRRTSNAAEAASPPEARTIASTTWAVGSVPAA